MALLEHHAGVHQGIVVAPSEGTAYALGSSKLTFKVVGADTGGAYAAAEFVIAPGGGAGLHVHRNEDEAFSIIEGAVTFQLGERTIRAEAGSYVFIPRGLRHAFVNAEQVAARTLMIVTPAGLEHYFAELDALLRAYPGGPPAEQVAALNAKYNLEFTSA